MTEKLICNAPKRPYLLGRNEKLRLAVMFRPRCRSWACPACAEVNKALWIARTYHGAETLSQSGLSLYFLTLTSHERLKAEQTLYVWPKAWAKLRDKMKYVNGGVFQYLMVPERHQDQRLHIHAVETAGLSQSVVKDLARESGLGYMATEDEIATPAGAAFYAGKYLSKQLDFNRWPKGFRRVRTSQGWPKLPEQDKPEGWLFNLLDYRVSVQDEMARLSDSGFYVTILDHISAWDMINYGEVPPEGDNTD